MKHRMFFSNLFIQISEYIKVHTATATGLLLVLIPRIAAQPESRSVIPNTKKIKTFTHVWTILKHQHSINNRSIPSA